MALDKILIDDIIKHRVKKSFLNKQNINSLILKGVKNGKSERFFNATACTTLVFTHWIHI